MIRETFKFYCIWCSSFKFYNKTAKNSYRLAAETVLQADHNHCLHIWLAMTYMWCVFCDAMFLDINGDPVHYVAESHLMNIHEGLEPSPLTFQFGPLLWELNLASLGWEPTLLATTLASLKRCRKATVEANSFPYNINTPYIKCIYVHKVWVILKWHFLSHKDIYFWVR